MCRVTCNSDIARFRISHTEVERREPGDSQSLRNDRRCETLDALRSPPPYPWVCCYACSRKSCLSYRNEVQNLTTTAGRRVTILEIILKLSTPSYRSMHSPMLLARYYQAAGYMRHACGIACCQEPLRGVFGTQSGMSGFCQTAVGAISNDRRCD